MEDHDLMRFLKDLDKPQYDPSQNENKNININKIDIFRNNDILKKKEFNKINYDKDNSELESRVFIEDCDIIACRSLCFSIESTWGDRDYVGLAGVEIYTGIYVEMYIYYWT